jgi:hypothetical protein
MVCWQYGIAISPKANLQKNSNNLFKNIVDPTVSICDLACAVSSVSVFCGGDFPFNFLTDQQTGRFALPLRASTSSS